MAEHPKKVLVKFRRIWRNHFPGEIASFDLAPRDAQGNFMRELDKEGRETEKEKKLLGDYLLEQMQTGLKTATLLTVEEALKHIGPGALPDYYSKESIAKALEKAPPEVKALQDGFAKGEAQRSEHGITEHSAPKIVARPPLNPAASVKK